MPKSARHLSFQTGKADFLARNCVVTKSTLPHSPPPPPHSPTTTATLEANPEYEYSSPNGCGPSKWAHCKDKSWASQSDSSDMVSEKPCQWFGCGGRASFPEHSRVIGVLFFYFVSEPEARSPFCWPLCGRKPVRSTFR